MGYSINRYTYSGSNEFDIAFTLGYIKKSDVFAYVTGEVDAEGNQVFRDINWVNDNRVQVLGDLETGDEVVLQRVVSKQALVVDFESEGTATRTALNTGFKQAIMAVHELYDSVLADTALVTATPDEVEAALKFISQYSTELLTVGGTDPDDLVAIAATLDSIQADDLNALLANMVSIQNDVQSNSTTAQTARDVAVQTANFFELVSAGLAGTSSGDFFTVPGANDSSLSVYKNNAGVAELVVEYPSLDQTTLAVTQATRGQFIFGKPDNILFSATGTNATSVFTVSWDTLRVVTGATTVRSVVDQAETTVAHNQCLYIDVSSYPSGGYVVQTGVFADLEQTFVGGDNILLLANYFGIALGVLAVSAGSEPIAENARRARALIGGRVNSLDWNGNTVTVNAQEGYVWYENNGGVAFATIADIVDVDLVHGECVYVDLDSAPNGSGQYVPQKGNTASSVIEGWQTGNKYILVARSNNAAINGEYALTNEVPNRSIGVFDGEAAFPVGGNVTWDSTTRTLTWPLVIMVVKDGTKQHRIKIEAGSIVVPAGDYWVVSLDTTQVDNVLTPNTAVTVGRYYQGGWDGDDQNNIPLFAAGASLSWNLRFPPVVGSSNGPAAAVPLGDYDPSEVVVKTSGNVVDIYMKGSNPLSNKYLKYRMWNNVVASNGADVYRWHEVWETDRTGEFTFTDTIRICNPGENETAIRQTGKSDFMGGNAHGDEQKFSVKMLVDGVVVDHLATANYRCRRVEFLQGSNLYEADTPTPQSNVVGKIYKRWNYEYGEVDIYQHLVWEDAITLQDTYLAMLTLLRTSGATQISDKGYRSPLWAEEDITNAGFPTVHSTAETAKASGPSGFSAEVTILKGWDKPNRHFNFSPSTSYNKFYFDFTGSGYVTTVGEVFESHAKYKLDTRN